MDILKTQRLILTELSSKEHSSGVGRTDTTMDFKWVVASAHNILTPDVVKDLPEYFQNIHELTDARTWVERMISESRFFIIRSSTEESSVLALGFLFLYEDETGTAHIGYLLGESHWGKGYAKECLTAFLSWSKQKNAWTRLIGGVEDENVASSNLLMKLGFTKMDNDQNSSKQSSSSFYQYQF